MSKSCGCNKHKKIGKMAKNAIDFEELALMAVGAAGVKIPTTTVLDTVWKGKSQADENTKNMYAGAVEMMMGYVAITYIDEKWARSMGMGAMIAGAMDFLEGMAPSIFAVKGINDNIGTTDKDGYSDFDYVVSENIGEIGTTVIDLNDNISSDVSVTQSIGAGDEMNTNSLMAIASVGASDEEYMV